MPERRQAIAEPESVRGQAAARSCHPRRSAPPSRSRSCDSSSARACDPGSLHDLEDIGHIRRIGTSGSARLTHLDRGGWRCAASGGRNAASSSFSIGRPRQRSCSMLEWLKVDLVVRIHSFRDIRRKTLPAERTVQELLLDRASAAQVCPGANAAVASHEHASAPSEHALLGSRARRRQIAGQGVRRRMMIQAHGQHAATVT